jgi:hypothetical protein
MRGVYMRRKNLQIAEHIHAWYEIKAKSLGIPVSALMIMALNDYMKQDSAISTMNDMMFEVNKLKKEIIAKEEQ